MTRRRTRRPGSTWLAAAVAATMAVGIVGCTDDRPAPDATARQLASALSEGDLAGVPFAGLTPAEAQGRWEALTADMDGPPKVRVAEVVEGEDATATATLDHAWDLPSTEEDWAHSTEVGLTFVDEAWSVEWSPQVVADLREGETLGLRRSPAVRGTIDGAGGTKIVTDRPVVRFGIDKTKVAKARQAASARALATLVEIDPASYAERVQAAGEKAFVEAIVLRRDDVPPVVTARYPDIAGAVALGDEIPLAPSRDFARPLLGTVGEATAEMIEKSGGRLSPGDQAGLSGLQGRYDEQLAGTGGVEVLAKDDAEAEPRVLFEVVPVDGQPLATTLDVDAQLLAEQLLAGVGPASALVALRPSTGEVVAAASGPGGGGYSTATVGQYAPGSTFKVVSSLALLRAGLTAQTAVPCTPTITVEGKEFENYDDYPASGIGRIPLRTAVANSCNTAFISQRERLQPGSLAEAAAALGLGVDHDLGFPVFLGSVPTDMSGTDLAASAIGQGRVLASPMAMAAVVASVARGETVVPRLLPEIEAPAAAPGTPLTPAEAKALRDLMRGVVTGGSGAFLADVPGPPVIAKTGTAEFGTRKPPQTHAWMVAARDDLAVAVFVEVGESGSRTAGPILEEFLRRS